MSCVDPASLSQAPSSLSRGPQVLAPGSNLTTIARLFDEHHVPSLFTPSGWYRCGNLTSPLTDDWEELLEAAAEAVRPFIANGTVVGIFYGDEISCTCNVPFWAVDAATAYFR